MCLELTSPIQKKSKCQNTEDEIGTCSKGLWFGIRTCEQSLFGEILLLDFSTQAQNFFSKVPIITVKLEAQALLPSLCIKLSPF